ncbi:MAG TPA: TIGR03086 family metal-binding protein [Pseudonocardia sp.]|nr:TIGR03086 family metal-binding protein [Pseudonocardia sp.]
MTTTVPELYRRCSAEFTRRLPAAAGRWPEPTPLPGWDVRRLVHHVVEEERWAPPLLAGQTIEQVGDRLAGDLLGDDPVAAGAAAAAEAETAVAEPGALERTVHLSFGDYPGAEYAMQLAADHLVHAVDLARALGLDETVDATAAAAIVAWFEPMEASYRTMGVIGPRVEVAADAGPAARLLGMMGRRP